MACDFEHERARRDARSLLRAVRRDDPAALERASAVLGVRLADRFVYADALHVVAREHGHASWPALVAGRRRGAIRATLDAASAEAGREEVDVDTGVAYPDGTPVLITVRRRERRYMLDDDGATIARAGRPAGWVDAAERAVRRSGMNVSPITGAIFVPAVEGRDLESLAARLARAALDVYEALLELDEPRTSRR